MRAKKGLRITGLIFAVSFVVFINQQALFSEDTLIEGGVITSPQNEPEIQWVWGEVINTDAQNKAITVKYLDYETDQEKEIIINVNDKTTFENIKSIDEIKPKDTLSIDYTISPDGKNTATNISVERPEESQGTQVQPEENILVPFPEEENKEF